MTTFFHGGHEVITAPNERGLFVSTHEGVTGCHGPVVSEFEIDDDDILEHSQLCDIVRESDDAIEKIDAVLRCELGDDVDLDRVWDIVVHSAGCVGAEDEVELFRAEDAGEAGWEAQRIRGRICAALGYRVIEMEDEHGASYLMVR